MSNLYAGDVDAGKAVSKASPGTTTTSAMTKNVLQKAIEEQAKHLGMDIEKDKEFFWLAKESLNATLPSGWMERKLQRTGQTYYVNKQTGESLWEHPSDEKYKKRFKTLKKMKQAEDAKKDVAEVAPKTNGMDKKKNIVDSNDKVLNTTNYKDIPGSPEVTRLKGELAGIRKKKELLTNNQSAAATLESIRKEHGRLEKKLKLEEAKKILKKQSDSFTTRKKQDVDSNIEPKKEKRRNSVAENNHLIKTKAWAITWLSRILDKKKHSSLSLRLSFRTWVLSVKKDTESESAALSYMKDMALVEDELKARDMLIEQLTIKLTASEDACTTLMEEYSKLQTQMDENFDNNIKFKTGLKKNSGVGIGPPQSISGKTHISMVPSPGINKIINKGLTKIYNQEQVWKTKKKKT